MPIAQNRDSNADTAWPLNAAVINSIMRIAMMAPVAAILFALSSGPVLWIAESLDLAGTGWAYCIEYFYKPLVVLANATGTVYWLEEYLGWWDELLLPQD